MTKIKWKTDNKSYELEVRNVGKDKSFPIQMGLEEWNGKRTRYHFIDIPKEKVDEFLKAISEAEK